MSDSIKDYLPIITAFLGAFLAYAFNGRKYNFERFHKEALESLKAFYSPAFHEMRKIRLENDLYKKENLMSDFIKNYTSKESQLFKSYNGNLIDLFYDLDEAFIEFKNKRKDENKDKYEDIFNEVYYIVENEYWDIQKSLYKQYPWYKKLNRKSYIYRFIMEVTVLFYDAVQFLAVVWLFVIYTGLFNKFTGKNKMPNWIINNFADLTSIVISLNCFGLIFASPYLLTILDYKRKSKFIKKVDKKIDKKIKEVLNSKNKKVININR